jgi:hypothetical protein
MGEDKLTLYRSSEHVERLFCSKCGCQFSYKNLERNRKLVEQGEVESIDISLGTLDEQHLREDPEIVPWRIVYYNDGLPWMQRIIPSEEEIQRLAT